MQIADFAILLNLMKALPILSLCFRDSNIRELKS